VAFAPYTDLDETAQIREEVAGVIELSPAQRAAILLAVCESAMLLAGARGAAERARVLAWRDPVTPETERLLARLRDAR
jgi:hypothetical protein